MRRIPTATYRLQFREGMTFERAAGLADYWQRLGIGHLYASPIFEATAGSTHGYDVTDHGALDADLGGREGFEAMSAALRRRDMGLVLDIVPNHMAASLENPWYRDVLRHGQASRYARHFDIDWAAPKLLVTTLGAPYGTVLEKGEFGLTLLADGPAFTIYDLAIPLDPTTWELVFDSAPEEMPTLPSAPHAEARTEWFERLMAEGHGHALKKHLARLGEDTSALNAIHEAQPWRLTYWRAARDTLTHRRFFEITDLIGVRVEDEAVFDDVHALLFELIEGGHVHGVRVDHVDGLADPAGYLEQLHDKMPKLATGEDVPVWVEKILGPDEHLPDPWPVEGTTGYEAATFIAGAFVDPQGREPMTAAYDDFTGVTHDFDAMLVEAKREILTRNLAAELRLLTAQAQAIAADDPVARDYGFDTLRRAIIALASAMPVYRTYLTRGPARPRDRAILDAIEAEAVGAIDVEDAGAVGFVADLLRDGVGDEHAEEHERLRRRFQQTTGALMAKALEDTLFYRYHRLVALNEVGGEPETFGLTDEAFHAAVAERAEHQANGLVATATHDTKRGEDARMRQAAIAAHAEAWSEHVGRWDATLVTRCRERNVEPPEAEMRWLFYQALLGAWENTAERLRERLSTFLVKAAREAKGETSWVRTDEDYEARLEAFVAAALPPGDAGGSFLDAFLEDVGPIVATGGRFSLAQVALHLTLPGVPDIYQGTEDGDFSLVDPDNRRPPRFEELAARLDEPGEDFGGVKFALLHRLLRLRREEPDLFERGAYEPVGTRSEGRPPLAFLRTHEGARILVVVDRRAAPEGPTTLDIEGTWRDVVSGEVLEAPFDIGERLRTSPALVLRAA